MPNGPGESRKDSMPRDHTRVSLATTLVEDAFGHAGVYIVRPPNSKPVAAADLAAVGCVPLGARPIQIYPPKSRVLMAHIPQFSHPIILGALPIEVADPRLVKADSLVARSCVGVHEDPYHYNVFKDPLTDICNFSAGRPVDSLPGDWGYINDYGMGFFLGRAMAFMRASDAAKIEAFWGDDLLRIVGYNLQLYTAGAEEFRVNDEGEYNEVYIGSHLPWEAAGLLTHGDVTEQKDGRLKPGGEDAKFEPTHVDQQIIHRHVRLQGYLGDLYKEFVAVPPEDLEFERFANKTKYNGVLEITKNTSGAYAVRSAKEITLEKYSLIPVPKQRFSPDDPLGATRENYQAAGIQGDGEDHKVDEFEWGDDTDAGIRAAQLFDYHAWFFSRYTIPGLHQHGELTETGDWYLPEESDLTDIGTTVVFDDIKLGHKFRAELPPYGELTIDERSGHTVKYYRSRSIIKQLDDGSIVIEDGYGSQIVMSGGNIEMSCAGDIWQRPGRSAVTWAPRDIIQRAGNSVDVSASKNDIRLKAERNLHVLGGNSGTDGGILIENRAVGPATAADYAELGERATGHGITMKAAQSTIHVIGQSLHIGRNQEDPGQLTIDAGDEGTLYLRGKEIYTRTLEILAMLQASKTSPDRQMLAINQNSTVISTPMQIGGSVQMFSTEEDGRADLFLGGSVLAHGDALFDGQVISNQGFASKQGPFVAPLDREIPVEPTEEVMRSAINDQLEVVDQQVEVVENLAVESEDESAGNAEYQRSVGFSCRETEEDIKLDQSSFVIYESRWQQVLRKTGGADTWEEPEVDAPPFSDSGEGSKKTRPHPGQDAWQTWSAAYGEVELGNFTLAEGASKAKKRSEMTEEGKDKTDKQLKDAYLINVQD